MTSQPQRSIIKEALIKIEDLQSRIDALERERREPIAIVGIGCRFPGADGPDAFWQLLRAGRDLVTETPGERWPVDAYYDPDPDAPGKTCSRFGAFLSGIDQFAASFFGITPRAACCMQPEQRLLLEVAWQALEHAGISPHGLYGHSAGVFIGTAGSEYFEDGGPERRADIDAYLGTGLALSAWAGRLSYCLGLTGPSLAVDTACSSSLVAVHLACESLRLRECDLALAGGASLMLTPHRSIMFTKARMLSPDGRCKAFDAAADGYGRGEGCAIVVLKRLSEAQADGDNIVAVIRGSAVNQDGSSGGFTVPNGPSQEAVIRRALDRAGVDPSEVGFIEAHGTGTALGDPIELGALRSVFGDTPARDAPLAVGSVKTNVGHLEAAAGIAGLIKTALALRYGEIPPHLHFRVPNPHVAWDEQALCVPTKLTPWPGSRRGRIAGVSAFSFVGTNAHVVLEQPPPRPSRPAVPRGGYLLLLSAKTESALAVLAAQYATHIETAQMSLGDVCHTAAVGRAHFTRRLALWGSSPAALRAALAAYQAHAPHSTWLSGTSPTTSPTVAWLCSGAVGGAALAKLCAHAPVAQAALAACAEIFARTPEALLTDDTPFARFTLPYVLGRLWRSWGLEPAVLAGEGEGAVAAACLAGQLALSQTPARLATAPAGWQLLTPNGATALKELAPALAAADVTLTLGLGPAQAFPVETIACFGASDPWAEVLRAAAAFYVRGVSVDWVAFEQPYGAQRVPLPTYPFERERYWINFSQRHPAQHQPDIVAVSPGAPARLSPAAAGPATAVNRADGVRQRPALDNAYAAPSTELERWIAEIWQEQLGFAGLGVHDNFFDLGGDSIAAAQIANRLQKELGETVHVNALLECETIAALADYFGKHYPMQTLAGDTVERSLDPEHRLTWEDARAFERAFPPSPVPPQFPAQRSTAPIVFILCPPRSGSTLLRVMLGRHPRLFAPPELELLGFNTLQERKSLLSGPQGFLREGAIVAVMHARGCSAEEASRVLEQYEADGLACERFYALLQEWIGERILVDKTPSYAFQSEVLQRAQASFENAYYIHLTRHPCGTIKSFEEARIDLLFDRRLRARLPFSRRQTAELTWLVSHRNILEFLGRQPPARSCRVKFEDLLYQPEAVMRRLCAFLDLAFDPAMLEPYAADSERMVHGVHDESRMLGDIKFHQHRTIDASAAERWRAQQADEFLGDPAWQMAQTLGYERLPVPVHYRRRGDVSVTTENADERSRAVKVS